MVATAQRTLSLVDAVGEAMRQAMEADPAVIVMGEDVVGGAGRGGDRENTMGGSFGATKSLYPLFGASRVRDTPISEAGFVGAGLVFAGITDTCGMGMLLARMPWNRRGSPSARAACST